MDARRYISTIPFLLVIALLSGSCGSLRKTDADLADGPGWVTSRPVDRQYYHGIGTAVKTGSPQIYRNNARKSALDDIAAQIRTQLTSTTTVYQAEDRFGAREVIQSRIEMISNEHLEGYEYVDQWEDDQYIYKYYRLSVFQYQNHKEERKHKALTSARSRFEQAVMHEHTFDYAKAFSYYTTSLELIKDYLGESTAIRLAEDLEIDLGTESLSRLYRIVQNLRILRLQEMDETTLTQVGTDKAFIITDQNDLPVADIPVRFSYSGSYLAKDTGISNWQGIVDIPEVRAIRNRDERLTATIDLRSMARQATTDLDIRRMIENWQVATSSMIITPDR